MPAPLEIRTAAFDPASGVARVQLAGGAEGRGECAARSGAFPASIPGHPATSLESLRALTTPALWPALEAACLDATAQQTRAPLFQILGGPTRNKVRVLTPLDRPIEELYASGARAFSVPLPPRAPARRFVSSTVSLLESLRKSAGGDADFVLDARASLPPAEASQLTRALEGFHLLWLDEPCPPGNLEALRRLTAESVTPIGFGASVRDAAVFLELLRAGAASILRPDILIHGIATTRRIAVLAETHYVAVAPIARGGPIARTAALHLAASLPNFFIQELSGLPLADGYAALPELP